MSDQVEVPFDDKPSDQATLLLAAAEDLGLDPSVVGTQEGAFVVPTEVRDRAFGDQSEPEPEPEPEPQPPAKKATAKKTARKK